MVVRRAQSFAVSPYTGFGATGSALQTTGVLIARNLPPLLFGPFVGSVVDR